MSSYHLDHLEYLETEAIHVLREVAAGFERPAVLFSGGKDSICILRLAEKAFRPSDIPMPFLNVETGHEFPGLIEFRDRRAEEMGAKLIVRTVDEAIEKGLATATPGQTSRNKLQIPVLLGAIDEFQFDCCIGGARRDEEKARAKERFFSFRDSFGQWDPKTSGQKFGIYTTGASIPVRTCACFHSPTGRKRMYGSTSKKKTWKCRTSISVTRASVFFVAASGCPCRRCMMETVRPIRMKARVQPRRRSTAR